MDVVGKITEGVLLKAGDIVLMGSHGLIKKLAVALFVAVSGKIKNLD